MVATYIELSHDMATLLGGKLYVKTFSMLYVDCNGCDVFIV